MCYHIWPQRILQIELQFIKLMKVDLYWQWNCESDSMSCLFWLFSHLDWATVSVLEAWEHWFMGRALLVCFYPRQTISFLWNVLYSSMMFYIIIDLLIVTVCMTLHNLEYTVASVRISSLSFSRQKLSHICVVFFSRQGFSVALEPVPEITFVHLLEINFL